MFGSGFASQFNAFTSHLRNLPALCPRSQFPSPAHTHTHTHRPFYMLPVKLCILYAHVCVRVYNIYAHTHARIQTAVSKIRWMMTIFKKAHTSWPLTRSLSSLFFTVQHNTLLQNSRYSMTLSLSFFLSFCLLLISRLYMKKVHQNLTGLDVCVKSE